MAFDLDVDNDDLPDQLFALRLDTLGTTADKTTLNFTANINKKAGVYTESLQSCWFSNISYLRESVSSHSPKKGIRIESANPVGRLTE